MRSIQNHKTTDYTDGPPGSSSYSSRRCIHIWILPRFFQHWNATSYRNSSTQLHTDGFLYIHAPYKIHTSFISFLFW